MTRFFAFAAAAASIVAVPAIAQEASGDRPQIAAPAAGGSDSVTKDTKRYCINTESTGSRIARRTCLTRADWINQGVDPLKLMK